MSEGRPVQCTTCDRTIDEDARVCPHCGELQPSPILAAGLGGLGVTSLLFGVPLGVFTVGLSRWVGFALAVMGLGLAFGGYTAYLDAKARRRGRPR
ncbi:zinc ribbon domain-containing protein [Halopenitus sp. H-Gu1]|uniref:zinc ribbon domain-containing protein n=1 Tax=Halopenitus sp. H-Gu1 TaxID=3242697 RepID=UPI00359CD68E